MSYVRDLSSAIGKFKQAEVHHDRLEDQLFSRGGDETKRALLAARLDVKTGLHIVRIETLPDAFLRDIALSFGDAVQNLRSGLDHLAWQLALEHSGGSVPRNGRRIFFPIFDFARDKAGGEDGRVKSRRGFVSAPVLSETDPEHRPTFASFQPYRRGGLGKNLALLRDISNRDKHRLLVDFYLSPMSWSSFREFRVVSLETGKPMKIGAEVMRLKVLDPRNDVEMQYQRLTPEIRLDRRREPLQTFHEMRESVRAVFEAFGATLLSTSADGNVVPRR